MSVSVPSGGLADPDRDKWVVLFAHDLRKPLASLISSLHLMGDMLSLAEYDQIGLVLRIARESGIDLMDMLDSMLRDDSGHLSVAQPVALKPLVSRVLLSIRPTAEKTGTPLQDLIPAEFPLLSVSETGLMRLLRNLLDNALRYAPGGPISVGARAMQPEGERPFAEISVTDSGTGIPAAERERVFEFFYRAPQTAEKVRGYGLGLPFCKLMVERYGGRIWIEDGPTGGAVFRFTLPTLPNNTTHTDT